MQPIIGLGQAGSSSNAFIMEKEPKITGGATLWARKTIESEIFYNKPDKWFKIWFYLVNRASHTDTNKYKRGETFLQYNWICEDVNCTKDQLKKCLAWLRKMNMIGTRRSTRGVWLNIANYSHYQRLDNYYSHVKALEKHQRSTREAPRYNKNDKNDKNIYNISSAKNNFTSISDVVVKYRWQQVALEIISFLKDGSSKTSSVFKCCKDDLRASEIAFTTCKELDQKNVAYFLKVWNEIH